MRRKALHVTLNVREPSTVDLTVAERVQLVVCGGVDIESHSGGKDVPPVPKLVPSKGDELPGELPALTVED
jgi:hypothetical protein